MGIYLALMVVVFAVLIVFVVSVVKYSYKISKKITNNKASRFIITILPLVLIAIGGYIDFTNSVVVNLHLIIIIYLTKLVFYIIKKVSKKEFNEHISVIVGILLTVVVMSRAYYLAYHVVETDYEVFTSKNIGNNDFRIVQISDSHLGTTMTGQEFSKYMDDINKLNPDIVVVTGDFIDDNSKLIDFQEGARGLGSLNTKYGVYFIFGNHDKGYYNSRGYGEAVIRKTLESNNVKILEDECIDITENIVLIGRQDKTVENRQTIQNLTTNLDKNKYIIVLNHQPNDYENETNAEVDLVLSGHTHGGQLIPLGQLGVLLGANDKIYGLEKRNNTTFIVNSGISDWAMKFKTGTVSEYGVIDIKNK